MSERSSKKCDEVSDDNVIKRLMERSLVTEAGCWELRGFQHVSKGMKSGSKGYVDFHYKGERWKGHRLAYFITQGVIPPGAVVMHVCDNPPCCNPAHLILGDTRANMQDAGRKKRWPRQYRDTCIKGHPRTPENMVWHGKEQKLRCRICMKIKHRLELGWDPEEAEKTPLIPAGTRTARRNFEHIAKLSHEKRKQA